MQSGLDKNYKNELLSSYYDWATNNIAQTQHFLAEKEHNNNIVKIEIKFHSLQQAAVTLYIFHSRYIL